MKETKTYLEFISILLEKDLLIEEIQELKYINKKVLCVTYCFSEKEIKFINGLLDKYKVFNATK